MKIKKIKTVKSYEGMTACPAAAGKIKNLVSEYYNTDGFSWEEAHVSFDYVDNKAYIISPIDFEDVLEVTLVKESESKELINLIKKEVYSKKWWVKRKINGSPRRSWVTTEAPPEGAYDRGGYYDYWEGVFGERYWELELPSKIPFIHKLWRKERKDGSGTGNPVHWFENVYVIIRDYGNDDFKISLDIIEDF